MKMMNKSTIAALVFSSLPVITNATQLNDNFFSWGGTARVNYGQKSYGKKEDHAIKIDTIQLTYKAKYGNWGSKADYRFATNYKKSKIKTLLVTYDGFDNWHLTGGLNPVPFGNPNFISNSWWFGLPYYLGLEDQHELGIKAEFNSNYGVTAFGYYARPLYSAENTKRYSGALYTGNIVRSDGTVVRYDNEENNQFNIRQTLKVNIFGGETILGGSFEYGNIDNSFTGDSGNKWAAALSSNTTIDSWTIQLQALQYEFNAPNAPTMVNDSNQKLNDDTIAIGISNAKFEVASKGRVYNINVAKKFITDWLTFKVYNDFGVMTPETNNKSFDNSFQNVTGIVFRKGRFSTNIDVVNGKNMAFSTEKDNHVGLKSNESNWDSRFNINLRFIF